MVVYGKCNAVFIQESLVNQSPSAAAVATPFARPASDACFSKAQKLMPGGVNSPVRAFGSVGGGTPVIVDRAEGPYLYDIDGKRYVDFIASWGPAILGHAHPQVIEAVQQVATKGLSFGCPTEHENRLAELVIEAVPSIEMVRFVSSGTEAAMSAIRLARAYTGRRKIIKFAGCYHGHADFLLVQAGSGASTLGIPNSAGVTAATTQDTLTATYNDLASVEKLMKEHGDDIAAIAVEPVAGNMNCILPQPGFLEGLRSLCDQYGAALLFDEVMTGFRVAYGGAQAHYNVSPDITCLGKIVGGGMPVGAYGGKKAIMEQVAPLGPMYQAGTLSGNPLGMVAGAVTLELLKQPGTYETLSQNTAYFTQGLSRLFSEKGLPFSVTQIGAMFGLFFTAEPVYNIEGVHASDKAAFQRFFWGLLEHGVYWPPSAYEACFTTTRHSQSVLNEALNASEKALARL